MNKTLFLFKKEAITSPYTDKKTLQKAVKESKFLVLAQTEGYDYIDELTEQLDLIEDTIPGKRRGVAIFADLKEDHKNLLEKMYPQFEFLFIELE